MLTGGGYAISLPTDEDRRTIEAIVLFAPERPDSHLVAEALEIPVEQVEHVYWHLATFNEPTLAWLMAITTKENH